MALSILVFVLCLGCGDNEAANDDTGSDTNSENDSDTDTEPDTSLECPLNSGYPCACDQNPCEDGASCLGIPNQGTYYCSAECTEEKDCLETLGWGVGAGCLINNDGDDTPEHCVVKCKVDSDCPPGLTCIKAQAGVGWMGCF